MVRESRQARAARRGGQCAVGMLLVAGAVQAWAQGVGPGMPAAPARPAGTLNALGTTGGLAVPDAYSLGSGTVALGLSDAREPQLGPAQKPRSALLGIGLLPGLDVVGRVAEYGERDSAGNLVRTPSDLSFGFKASLALGTGSDAFRVAAGVNDLAGGASWFRSAYVVATQPLGRLGPAREVTATVGLGRSEAQVRVPGAHGALDGLFGGVSARVWELPAYGAVTAHAEFDGRQALAGARFISAPVPALGNATFNASLMQTAARGAMPAALTWGVGLSMPFGANERGLPRWQPQAGAGAVAAASGAAPGPMGTLAQLKQQLVAIGLEAVRVGRLADGGWMVHYQNRRFGNNEVDALGVVTGVAARLAPAEVGTLMVVAHKQGLPVLTLRTEAPAWRRYLENSLAAPLEDVTRVQRGGAPAATQVDWLHDEPSPATRLQLQLSPELNYALATEFGVFDYSLAGRVRATAPLPLPWKGTQLVATVQGRLDNTPNARPGGAFPTLLHDEGLQALAVHHTHWLGRRAVLGAAAGRFEYDAWGGEAEAVVFVPGRDDVIRFRGRLLERTATMPRGFERAGGTVYRWVGTPNLWGEVGYNRYTDGSVGPSLSVVRWWGDVGVSLNYRKGGNFQFAGLTLSFPLTPRAGMRNNEWVHVEGKPSYRQGLRTRVGNDANWVTPRAVRDLELSWDLDSQALNAGRLGPEYVMGQLGRMRQAYFLYGQGR